MVLINMLMLLSDVKSLCMQGILLTGKFMLNYEVRLC